MTSEQFAVEIWRTTKVSRYLNLGSYNYLRFGAADEYCTPRVVKSLTKYFASTCSTRVEGGTTALHSELEDPVADFVRKPSALVTGMGYATNPAILPVLIGKGGLIISDSLNHKSIVNGARRSGATIRSSQHNSPSNLEKVLRAHIADGQPRTHRPWKKSSLWWKGYIAWKGSFASFLRLFLSVKSTRHTCIWMRLTALEQLQ